MSSAELPGGVLETLLLYLGWVSFEFPGRYPFKLLYNGSQSGSSSLAYLNQIFLLFRLTQTDCNTSAKFPAAIAPSSQSFPFTHIAYSTFLQSNQIVQHPAGLPVRQRVIIQKIIKNYNFLRF